jgi:hypothetical protein
MTRMAKAGRLHTFPLSKVYHWQWLSEARSFDQIIQDHYGGKFDESGMGFLYKYLQSGAP